MHSYKITEPCINCNSDVDYEINVFSLVSATIVPMVPGNLCCPECGEEIDDGYMNEILDDFLDNLIVCAVCDSPMDEQFGEFTCSERCEEVYIERQNELYRDIYKDRDYP